MGLAPRSVQVMFAVAAISAACGFPEYSERTQAALDPDASPNRRDAALASCGDALKNGDESDTDCGGASCARCALGRGCRTGNDCESAVCTNARCVEPSCSDR